MHLLIFGATGRTGGALARQALAAGHRVSALVRAPSSELPSGVEAFAGDVLDAASVASVVRAEHAIVIALGGVDALTRGTANVVRAAVDAGARRALGVVGAGVLQGDAARLRSEMPDYPARFREIGAAHRAVYDALRGSPLEWTLACTPQLVAGARTERLRASADDLPAGTGAVTTEDVAAFLLDEADARRFVRARVGLNSG